MAANTTSEPLRRAAAVIELVAMEPEGLTVTQILERLDLPAATVFRIVRKLVAIGFLEGAGRHVAYRIGPRLHRISELLYGSESFASLASLIIQSVADELHLAVYLASLFENAAPLIITRLPANVRSAVVHPGPQFPVHASAGGKVLLAHQTKPERAEFFKTYDLKRYTDTTIVDLKAMEEHLADIVRKGYAVSIGEADSTLWGAACPIKDARGIVTYSVGVIGLKETSSDYEPVEAKIVPILRSAAARIEQLIPSVREQKGRAGNGERRASA